jgi:indolepyruvate ferredoxin oxidoreductase
MGDGTYYHSGLMAIRAAVAAGVNITYKILYNDAVAMTGGQPIDGPISVATIARQVLNEGVVAVHLLSDDPKRHRDDDELPGVVKVGHRDTLDEVQRTLRTTAGCSVLIYEQTCAAEKRRRRKRGSYPNPAKRLFIAKSVCEACGDCSVQSTCVSLVPVETAFGRKRAIDQSSCNKDYSCVNGFCPSFITVYGAEPRKRNGVALEESLFNDLPLPPRAPLGQDGFNLLVAGIGGTGVVTVGAVLGTAAHIDGFSASLFDVTGLSQKNGAVMSHVRIAHTPTIDGAQRLSAGEADVLLAFDLVAALSSESLLALRAGRTQAIANTDVAPTAAFQFERDFATDPEMLRVRLCETLGAASVMAVDASTLALAILGDTIGANLFMLGVAAQRGLLPVTLSAIEAAVTLNGVAVAFNLRALRLGRLFAVDPERVVALGAADESGISPLPTTLDEVIDHRASHLTDYQGPALALRYRQLVARVREVEARICPGSEALTLAVARNYAKLLAYKDEYEVARLLTSAGLHEEIRRSFEDGGRVAFNMAPPLLGGSPVNGRPGKREFGPWIIGVLGVLKRLRGLRGTPLDPFGLSAERRAERALITEYEALTARLLQSLSPAKLTQAVALLGLADAVRGFGPVKQAAIDAYRASIKTGEAAYRSAPVPAPQPVEEHV